jgi:hypothetical protein
MALNRKQLASLWGGVTMFTLVGLFPPWAISISLRDSVFRSPSRYAFIGTPVEGLGAEIDLQRLLIGWAIVVAVTAALMVSCRESQ